MRALLFAIAILGCDSRRDPPRTEPDHTLHTGRHDGTRGAVCSWADPRGKPEPRPCAGDLVCAYACGVSNCDHICATKAEVLPRDKQGKRHFGVVLPWAEWQSEVARLEQRGEGLLGASSVEQAGTADEHGKLYLSDPSGNVIEMKAYRDVERTLGLAL